LISQRLKEYKTWSMKTKQSAPRVAVYEGEIIL
jgi:hypothetical protein